MIKTFHTKGMIQWTMKKLFTLLLTALICITACFSLTACGKDITETDDQLAALTEVKAGTSDIAVIDSVMAGYYVKSANFSDLMIIQGDQFVFENEYYAIGARKGGNTDARLTLYYGVGHDSWTPAYDNALLAFLLGGE